ncbi:MAG TPA: hypothetical protein PLL55_07765, partial [Candidatus Aminicenantes bacterium]|nr:hypothetical protein [Candidatus Aminicenantes bacterium]HOY99282.1 hypothetical protein [Candidatus Aminicenantes bacterium]HPH43761.1 hypothetical protein [Candidatus Aminicenantes bacterium]HPN16765.1 hypothetical protein [Candidatus Aminicenantes bacterium]
MAEQTKPTSPVKERTADIFDESFFVAGKAAGRKALAFPVAVVLHLILVVALVVLPLLSVSNLPQIEITSAFLAPPPPPP